MRCGCGPEAFRASGTRRRDRPLGCRKFAPLRRSWPSGRGFCGRSSICPTARERLSRARAGAAPRERHRRTAKCPRHCAQVAGLAWKKLAGPALPRLKRLVALRGRQRSKAVDPKRSGLALHRAEIPECRLDPGHSVFWDLRPGRRFSGFGQPRR